MLTFPGAWFYWGGQMYPVSQNEWYMFGPKAQAQQVFDQFMKNFPTSKLKLVSATQTGQAAGLFLPPTPNPQNIDIWLMQGTVDGQDEAGNPTSLAMNEYAPWLWDRGPVLEAPAETFGGTPVMTDVVGSSGPIGPSSYLNLIYDNIGGALAQAHWSTRTTPSLKYPATA